MSSSLEVFHLVYRLQSEAGGYHNAPGSAWRPPECLVVLEDLLLEDPVRHAVVRVRVLASLGQLLVLRLQRVY